MAGPFPGMDPYLEDPVLWPGVRQGIVGALRAELNRLLASQVNLIEIDLLRHGEHTAAAPRSLLRRRCRWDYLICLHRAAQRHRFEAWSRTVRERLPRFSLPLAHELPDIIADLQMAFERDDEDGAYARRIDHTGPRAIPVSPEDADWAAETVRANAGRA